MHPRSRIVLLALSAALASLPRPAAAQTFQRITDPANPIVAMGGNAFGYAGAAWVDADSDGDLDLFIATVGLFRNDGAGAFTAFSGLPALTFQFGNSWADVDNDGDLDVYTSGGFGTGSWLFLNQGAMTFTPVTAGPIGNALANRGWGCAMADYDVDGRVDIVVANGGGGFVGGTNPNRLFHNDGGGNFSEVTGSGISTEDKPFTVPTWSDYDQDGDPDLFFGVGPVNGTVGLDDLYRNLKESAPGTFQRITTAPLGTDLQDGQVYHWVDYDNDGDLDVYLTNYIGTSGVGMGNRLYRNFGGAFVAQTGAIATDAAPSLSAAWQDYDNDGDLDCLVTNDNSNAIRFYRNNGNATFSAANIAGLTVVGPHWCATSGDYDDDGRMDLYITGTAATAKLMRNTTSNGNHWLKVRLTGTVSNRSAIGARVRVRAVIGGVSVWQMREISAQNTFDGMHALEAHFGLGAATTAEEVVVQWPSGIQTTLTGVAADTRLAIVEDAPTAVAASLVAAAVEGGVVRLEWWVPDAAGETFRIERATEGRPWAEVGRVTVVGAGSLRYEDATAVPGTRIGYRLARGAGASAESSTETWIEVPAAQAFGIRGVTPNPGRAPFDVRFALTSRESATIELLDVAGRRVASTAIANPAPGALTVRLETPARVAHGVYFVRLAQGSRQDVRRIVAME